MPSASPPKTRRLSAASIQGPGPTRTSPRCANSSASWASRLIGVGRWRPATPTTTAGPSGCSCSSSTPAWPTRRTPRSTGIPSTRPCSPMSRWMAKAAPGAPVPWWRSASCVSGSSRSPPTPMPCSMTCPSSRAGRSGCAPCRPTGLAAPPVPSWDSRWWMGPASPRAARSRCSPPGPTPFLAPATWC